MPYVNKVLVNKRMEGKLRIKRVPFSNFLLWLQSVQIPPHKYGCKGSKKFLIRNAGNVLDVFMCLLSKYRVRLLMVIYEFSTIEM
jgi:hypothetical protein